MHAAGIIAKAKDAYPDHEAVQDLRAKLAVVEEGGGGRFRKNLLKHSMGLG